MAQTMEVLARRGYVAVAPDYRLAPAHTFPAQVEDCKCAVRWLRAHAKEYRVDPDRIGVMGLAAGGHLACLLAVTDRADGRAGTGGPAAPPRNRAARAGRPAARRAPPLGAPAAAGDVPAVLPPLPRRRGR